jgi:hypothetical protein
MSNKAMEHMSSDDLLKLIDDHYTMSEGQSKLFECLTVGSAVHPKFLKENTAHTYKAHMTIPFDTKPIISAFGALAQAGSAMEIAIGELKTTMDTLSKMEKPEDVVIGKTLQDAKAGELIEVEFVNVHLDRRSQQEEKIDRRARYGNYTYAEVCIRHAFPAVPNHWCYRPMRERSGQFEAPERFGFETKESAFAAAILEGLKPIEVQSVDWFVWRSACID